MDVMNLIHEICLIKDKINKTPKWKFISRNKLLKQYNEDINKFKELDVFSASNNMITFLLSLDPRLTAFISGELVSYDLTHLILDIKLGDNAPITSVTYNPTSGTFDVMSRNVSYTVYDKNKLGKRIRGMWEPLSYKIKERYVEIIIQMADELSKTTGGDSRYE